MSDRPRYWLDLPNPEPPTRAAWLRHRLAEAASFLRPRAPDPWTQPTTSEEEWIRLSEQALGPLPRPAEFPRQEGGARSGVPNAREPASKSESHSPKAAQAAAH